MVCRLAVAVLAAVAAAAAAPQSEQELVARARDPRACDHTRYPQRHRFRELHPRMQLHHAPRHPETFNVTLELVRRGYTEEQIGKIWSGNLLRVWGEVENVARDIQAGRK